MSVGMAITWVGTGGTGTVWSSSGDRRSHQLYLPPLRGGGVVSFPSLWYRDPYQTLEKRAVDFKVEVGGRSEILHLCSCSGGSVIFRCNMG